MVVVPNLRMALKEKISSAGERWRKCKFQPRFSNSPRIAYEFAANMASLSLNASKGIVSFNAVLKRDKREPARSKLLNPLERDIRAARGVRS